MKKFVLFWRRLFVPSIFGVDDAIIGAIALAGSSAYAASRSEDAAQSVNTSNTNAMTQANEFNADQAYLTWQRNTMSAWQDRDFQERMSNTAYQRATEDMKAAGINPLLAVMKGGATTPGGAMGNAGQASSVAPIPKQNAFQAGLNSGLQVAQAFASQKNIDADTALKKAQTAREMASAGQAEATTKDILYKLQEKVPEEIRVLRAEQGSHLWRQAVDAAQEQVLKMEKLLKLGQIELVDAQTQYERVKTLLSNLAVPEARNAANAQDSWWMRNVSPYLPDVLKSTGAAGAVRGLAR